MAYNSGSQVTSPTITTSEFRGFFSLLMAVLEAGGVVKTADTGQIDWSTVNVPSSNNVAAGYEIRRLSDGLQGTSPIYIKFEFGRGNGTPIMGLWVSFGTGSDGAGNLTGVRLARFLYEMSGAQGTYQLSAYADPSGFWIMAHRSVVSSSHLFLAERTTDAERNPTTQGINYIFNGGPAGIVASRHISNTGAVPPNDVLSGAALSGLFFPGNSFTSGLKADGTVAIYPWFMFGHGEMMYPLLNVVGCFAGDFTDGQDYQIRVRGTDQTMIKIPNVFSASISRGSTAAHLLLRTA